MPRSIATPLTPGSRSRERSVAPVRRGRRALLLGVLLVGLVHLAIRPASAQAAVWIPESSGTTSLLAGVSCLSPSFCMAAGFDGTTTSYNGTRWTSEGGRSTENYWDVSCVSSTFCKAVGTSIRSYNGTGWSNDRSPSPFVAGYTDVTCVSISFCKAVGDQGKIITWNGATWSHDISGTTEVLQGIACASASVCKAVGFKGTILTWNGSAWSAERSRTTEPLRKVACTSATFCKAVGDSGTILSYDGDTWRSDPGARASTTLQGITCLSVSFCKVVGNGGRILTWDGSAWTPDSSGTTAHLADVSCAAPDTCKAVGDKGTILSLAPSDSTTTREYLVNVECAGTSQSCHEPMPFELPLRASGVLRVRFVTSTGGCSDIRVSFTVGNRTDLPFLGVQETTVLTTTSAFLAHGASTDELGLDSLPSLPGDTFLRLTAEGREGGCNTGRLERFSGTLIVISSE